MSQDLKTVSIRLLEKEYSINCPPEARTELEAAAQYLDDKMAEIRHNGKLIGLERIAVMAALNITHELIKERGSHEQTLKDNVEQLCLRIDNALSHETKEPENTID
ncbi:cell division protein ZapA [Pontibacterium sp. N1Y112]|uniref:Cell division protein ZapA n=1 Tax=Pontibacterium sinense TaxID=2781979 RepID=A0A8J7JYV4_9GAMM|nr:cell division protein ZapA [Pontibacterium sinense]MBE9396899.1 cell division protein ZapA [Pontibacterium sinense]